MQLPTRLVSALLAISAVSACADDGTTRDGTPCTGGKCDGADDDNVCNDPGYGDGVCQTDLACAAPDIDCFVTFDDDATAGAWFLQELEPKLAIQESRPERDLVSEADARFVHTRALLDRGWEAFAASRPVADLAAARPALLLVEDDQVNAHATADTASEHAVFAVIVNSGLLVGRTDEQVLAVMMHEFQHAIGLHVLDAVKEPMRRFYIAMPGEPEPIGRTQPEDPDARTFGTAWRAGAEWAGPYAQAELGSLPFQGDMHQVFNAALLKARAQNQADCDAAIDAVNTVFPPLVQQRHPLSGALIGDLSDVASDIPGVESKVASCLSVITKGFVEFLVDDLGAPSDKVEQTLGADGHAAIEGKPLWDAMAALITAGRDRMRTAETGFVSEVGLPWSSLRYFSYEEDADDVSVMVLRAAGMDPTGSDSILSLVDQQAQSVCLAIIDAGEIPPFGVDLGVE
ncbi:MAG: hypothetical protein AB7L28_21510, partial [Kofleriaceae bacterium]